MSITNDKMYPISFDKFSNSVVLNIGIHIRASIICILLADSHSLGRQIWEVGDMGYGEVHLQFI